MKRNNMMNLLLALLFVGSSQAVLAQVGGWKAELVEDSKAALNAMVEKQPKLQSYVDKAYGYAVFPVVGRGGMVVGGSYGKGRVYRQGNFVGSVTMAKLSVGFQAGGQAFSEIIFLQDKRAFDEFTSGEFEFSAQAEAIAVTASAGAQAGTEGASASAGADLETTAGAQGGRQDAAADHPLHG